MNFPISIIIQSFYFSIFQRNKVVDHMLRIICRMNGYEERFFSKSFVYLLLSERTKINLIRVIVVDVIYDCFRKFLGSFG